MSDQLDMPNRSLHSSIRFVAFSAIAAVVAALAAGSSVALSVPVWAMFVGWVAFFTRGVNARDGAINLACVWLGLAFGVAAALAVGALTPPLGRLALPAVVFAVAIIVVSLRGLPLLNNVLAYFLGLIAFFASHLEPSLESLFHLGGASTLGSSAGWLCVKLQQRLAPHS
ncbi:DUF1097 domain-containing protein [Zestomonas carbonaria]|uniref:DUF1097 domain-containing protein n=1 Tax=Zestomonas carbonaria TaxID=2762745 RepID=A0A7U7IBH4_9GAMM|nr:DUF1097 domain-containing protein [Pseudomonas carbonaria]CAD5110485.1 hypothetical protein PSEWESI4_04808 [Pseudomonas carbonaria]